ncbi:MAG TPA: FAD-dependent oxidoreductase [Pirellulaceae bacterium]|nr:FAD-dependent oxidoreductase [Pirellulaceae bacterium]
MKIAIIGGGVSGLVAAYKLHERHDVTVFEANGYPGGHTNTVDIELDGERHAVDTGFIVYNERNYPHFVRLLAELGVATKPTTMTFGVRDDRVGLEYNGESLDKLFAQRRNLLRPSFHRMLLDILRFNRETRRIASDESCSLTLGEFLRRGNYSRAFAERYLLPMGSAIWSCPTGDFAGFPVRFVAEFYENHGLLNLIDRPQWRVIEGGSRTYVEKLIRSFRERVRLRTPVASVQRSDDGALLRLGDGRGERFDRVIFACHADQALRLLGHEATRAERKVLKAFPYNPNVAVLHTDESTLPRSRKARASWNYRIAEGSDAATVTYDMTLLQGLPTKRRFLVTLNDEQRIAPERVLARFVYEHPSFDLRRASAQARHAELNRTPRTAYCGAYWGNGFHEDGVVSALVAVESVEQAAERERTGATTVRSSAELVAG